MLERVKVKREEGEHGRRQLPFIFSLIREEAPMKHRLQQRSRASVFLKGLLESSVAKQTKALCGQAERHCSNLGESQEFF
jgi:hypothetical protein